MSRVLTFSRVFPSYHPKRGEPTYFVEKILASLDSIYPLEYPSADLYFDSYPEWHNYEPKHHTIRAGKRWKAGDYFSPRVWSGKPYQSKMITIAPDMEVKKTWDFDLENNKIFINKKFHCSIDNDLYLESLAINDGLKDVDLLAWFKYPNPVKDHQIICWNENINY